MLLIVYNMYISTSIICFFRYLEKQSHIYLISGHIGREIRIYEIRNFNIFCCASYSEFKKKQIIEVFIVLTSITIKNKKFVVQKIRRT